MGRLFSKFTIILLLLVAVPLAIVGWLGARIVRDEQMVLQHQVRELTTGQLRAIATAIQASLKTYEQRVLEEMRPLTTDVEVLRQRGRESALVTQMYVLGAEGNLVFPPMATPASLTTQEREALQRTASVWDGGSLFTQEGEDGSRASSGWHTWYWGNGLQWMYWLRDGNQVYVAELNRSRLIAELIAALPDAGTEYASKQETTPSGGRVRLLDSAGLVLYQWGGADDMETPQVVASLPLEGPLRAWTLDFVNAGGSAFGKAVENSFLLTLIPSLALMALVVAALAYFLHQDRKRTLLEAEQRVSFVNQVSHELKTPLTNIRMYAEMLEQEVDDSDPKAQRYLHVIVSESQRLSRLIANVLSFSRKQRDNLSLHRQNAIPDEVLRQVLEQFQPALLAKGIVPEIALHAPEPRSLDPDALGQIVGNLVNNVEKYAAAGKHLRLSSETAGDLLRVTVEDRGPGVPERERERIFEAFYRVHDAVSEGVSGTGIGLSISRELARLHGGDVTLEAVQSGQGSRFVVTLHCPLKGESA